MCNRQHPRAAAHIYFVHQSVLSNRVLARLQQSAASGRLL